MLYLLVVIMRCVLDARSAVPVVDADGRSLDAAVVLLERPEEIARIAVQADFARAGAWDRIMIWTDEGEPCAWLVPSAVAVPLMSALGRWCPRASIELPSHWVRGGAPDGRAVVVRPRVELPVAQLRRD